MTWEASSVVTEDWGRLQVVIGNQDLSFYRGQPTIVHGWGSAEPFDDKACTLEFPGITSYESVEDLPFKEFDNVDIYQVDKNNQKVGKALWEGFIGSLDDVMDGSNNSLTIGCVGALYQADLFLKAPSFGFPVEDAGISIATEMNLRARYYGLRTKQMNWLTWMSVPHRNRGSWNPLLTGWIQELLSQAYSPAYFRDDETAVAVAAGNGGYVALGDHATFSSFGERFPNYGSATWWNAIFIHLFKDEGLRVTDMWYDKTRKEIYYLSKGGHVGRRTKNKTDEPGWDPWFGEAANHPELNYHAIHGLDGMTGYRIMNIFGQVKCYGAATHYGDGPALSVKHYSATPYSLNDIYIDMARTPSGNGYWLLSWGGEIHAFGDATSFANVQIIDTPMLAIETSPTGNGIYVLDAAGRIFTQGDAVHRGQPGPIDYTHHGYRDMSMTESGEGYVLVRSDGKINTYGDATYYGTAEFSLDPSSGGKVNQYTLMKIDGRRPVVRTKDTWTADWTVSTGQPGVAFSLNRDATQNPNTFYGEGTDTGNCKWRNTKYPNFNPGSPPPLWPGYYMSTTTNANAPGVSVWQQRMKDCGWPITVDGYFDVYDRNICKWFQSLAGILVDGVIGPQTWTATFQPGSSGGDLSSAYIAPLAIDPRVEPFIYNANGASIGDNPSFDRSIMRIESFASHGEHSSLREATIAAQNEAKRNVTPGWAGTVTLSIDPEEGSRFRIKAGDNLLLRNYRGEDLMLHIAGADIDMVGLSVTLTVDSKARDLMSVTAMIERDRTIGDWALQPTRPSNNSSKQVNDSVVFDCESKAGYIPYFVSPGGLWNVIKIPVGELGTVVKTEFQSFAPASTYSVAMFDRHITANKLQSLGSPMYEDFWKNFPEDLGLMISWGDADQMAGYFPGAQSDGDPATGRMVDSSSWNFWSSEPPWIYVAFWVTQTCAISGRLYPGPDAGFNFASTDAIANPMEIRAEPQRTPADFGPD